MKTIFRSLILLFILGAARLCVAGPIETWKQHREAILADPHLIAYYDFQEGAGEVLKNQSKAGKALDGTIHGGEWSEGRFPGKKALRFDGASTFVEIADHPALMPGSTGGDGFTILAWVRATSSKTGGIVDKTSKGWGKDTPYFLCHNPETAGFGGGGGNATSTYTGVGGWDPLKPEEATDWVQLAMTVNDDTLTLYRNGRVISEKRQPVETPGPNGLPLLIGCLDPDAEGGKFFFEGSIDEVILLDRALDRHQIKADWIASKTGGQPMLALHSPAGGEQWAAGSTHRILWTASDESRDVKLEYSTDGGRTWRTIADNVKNESIEGLPFHLREHSQFLWKIPSTVSAQSRLRVSQTGDPRLSDETTGNFAIIPSQELTSHEWVKVTDQADFAARDGAGGLSFDGKMWLIAGWNPSDKESFPRVTNNEVWSSRDGVTWELVRENSFKDESFDASADWEGRHAMGTAVHDGHLWILGGDFNQGHAQSDVWKSRDGAKWERMHGDVPWAPRAFPYALAHDGKLWIMGGQSRFDSIPEVEEVFYNDVWNSPDGVEWTRVTAEAAWHPRGLVHGSAVLDGRMWLIGGGTYTTSNKPDRLYFHDVWSSANGADWTRHTEHAPWAPRQMHNVAVFEDRMWMLAGYNGELGGDRNDVWYSADGVNWYELPETPWHARHAGTVIVHDNALWMLAGVPGLNERSVWKLVRR